MNHTSFTLRKKTFSFSTFQLQTEAWACGTSPTFSWMDPAANWPLIFCLKAHWHLRDPMGSKKRAGVCVFCCVCTACNLWNNRAAYTRRIRDRSLTAEQITHSGNKLCVCMCICRCVCVCECVWGSAPPPANTRVKHKAIQLSTRPEGGGSTREE